ncbi:carboxypeptidase regulatory-like domain-containing protein, partial [archaeon]|nr:carboxypeptidase regulatory-like domain-containing protein [archaeon]
MREGITTSIVDEYTTQISSDYRLNFDLTSVSETPFSATQLVIKDRSSGLSIESYSITTATGEQRTGSKVGSELSIALGELSKDSVVKGEIVLNTRKEGTIPLEISILSGSGSTVEVYKKTIYVKVEPADSLNVDILPKVIVPFINNNLLVRVTTEDDQTISNAFVTLVKDEDIIASGQTDIDGIFAYTLLSPGDGATISVVVEKAGFKPSEKQITVSSNILFTEPPAIRLNLTVGGTAFKTLDADLLNATLIPLTIDKLEVSKVFQGFAAVDFEEPSIGTTIGEDSNTSLFATIRLGPEGKVIVEPLKLLGAINIHVSNSNFDQTWLATIPFELSIGFGDEVDDSQCFNVFPSEWNIFGSTSQTQSFTATITNTCVVDGEKVSLRNISARIVAGNDNLLGSYRISSSIDGGISAQLENTFKKIADTLGENSDESITIEFQPDNIISGASQIKIEIEATHFTANGEDKLTQRINVKANINDLAECVEVLTDREVVVQACPYNTGYGNYGGGRFNNYNNSRYSGFDPYSQFNGYGTGNP